MALRIALLGLGPIGAAVLRQIVERPGFVLGAAVDTDPGKIGRDAAEACGLAGAGGEIEIEDRLGSAAAEACDVAVVCASSSLTAFVAIAEELLSMGLPIVSTTEELAYPHRAQPALTRRLDDAARAAGVAVLGTGVNPGFAMDTLGLVLTAPCERVDRISIERFQDAGLRRVPFQKKVGAGLEPERFEELVAAGRMGHVGFPESVAMIAAAVGWQLDEITDTVRPKIADQALQSGLGPIAPGQVAGIVQDAVGFRNGADAIRLHMEAYVGARDCYDAVHVEGSPSLSSRIEGGIPGDVATASMALNAIPGLLTVQPGLRTMADLPMPRWWSGEAR